MIIDIEESREIAAHVNAVNAARTQRAQAAVHLIGALLIAVLGALALLLWLTPCDAGTLCMGMVCTPTRTGPHNALRRAWRRWYLRWCLRDMDLAADRIRADIELLPQIERDMRRQMNLLRVELATLEQPLPKE